MIFSPWASILAFHWLKWAWNLACIWHIVKTWEMVVFFLFKKFHQILEFKRAANSADKCFKSVTAGYFSGPAPHTCVNNRTRKHKSWNSFCGGWNITLLLPKSNMVEFSYRISPRNDAMGETDPEHVLFEGCELKGKNQKVQSVGCLCRRLTNTNEKVFKVCVVALIYLTYFTNSPQADFFRDSERMTNFVSVVQNWKIRSAWPTSLT